MASGDSRAGSGRLIFHREPIQPLFHVRRGEGGEPVEQPGGIAFHQQHRAMVDALSVGTEIVTGGGVLGKVTEVGEQFLTVEVSDGVTVKVQRHSISAVLPKDTIKHA